MSLLPNEKILFPTLRGKHSHRCGRCGQGTYCYKAGCQKPQKIEICFYCRPTGARPS